MVQYEKKNSKEISNMGFDNKNNWISDIGIGTDNQNLYQKLNFALTTKYLFQNLDKLDMPSQ